MEINVDQLKKLYENNSNEYVCNELDISLPTLLRYLKDAGIPSKGKGGGLAAKGKKKIQVVG